MADLLDRAPIDNGSKVDEEERPSGKSLRDRSILVKPLSDRGVGLSC